MCNTTVVVSYSLNLLSIMFTFIRGSVAEWSKALVLGTSLFGGVGSNPTAAKVLF